MALYRDMVSGWHQGLVALDNKDPETALKIFTSVAEPHSKICFNVGCVHLLRGDLLQAMKALDSTISKDGRLAVGFFQRAVVHLKLDMHEEALSDCRHALTHLRNNSSIDYTQLGLKHKLYAWEVLYNTAAVQGALRQWQAAQESLEEALQQHPEEGSPALEAALAKVQKHLPLEPIQVPEGRYFRPRAEEVAQLSAKVVQGKPKIISSVIPHDEYTGFEPLRPQKDGFYEPSPNALGSGEAGYHRVQVHYCPPGSREVAVKAGSLVYVLQKVGDHANVIYDGQKLSLPTSLLEPISTPKGESRGAHNGIPLPPVKQPPTRPNLRPTVDDILPTRHPETSPTPSNSAKPLSEFMHREAAPSPAVQASPYREAAPYSREPRKEISVALQSAPSQGPAPSREGHEDDASKSAEKESKDSGKGENILLEEHSTESKNMMALTVHCSYTTSLQVSPDISLPDLHLLLKEKFSSLAGKSNLQISCKDTDSNQLKQISGDEDLHEVWGQAQNGTSTLWCKETDPWIGRSILYQMVALYTYPAEGPEDLQFEKGDLLDILSEVNDDWLEGRCHGKTGIFPKCFAVSAANDQSVASHQSLNTTPGLDHA